MPKIEIPRRKIPHHPSPLEMVAGVVRIAGVLLLAALGSILVLLCALVPMRIGGATPAQWMTKGLARTFLWITAVRLAAPSAATIRAHRGLVFINHLTYLDAVIMYARGPVRFLAASGIRSIPFIGQIGMAVGTVFVNRGDAESRAESRRRIQRTLQARPTPPVTLAPEGQIGPGGGVLPFRRGAFEVAVEAGMPIMPLVLAYEPFDAVVWQQRELLLVALWRLTARSGGVDATIRPLPVIEPSPATSEGEVETEATRLAEFAEAMYQDELQKG